MRRRSFLKLASGIFVPALIGVAPAKANSCWYLLNKASAAPAITPQSFPNLWAWFKADSFVGSDGDAVGTWADSSGNARDATQATGANKPVYKTGIFNGLPAIQFTQGTGRMLGIPNFTVGTGDFTLVKAGNVAADSCWFSNGSGVQMREIFGGADTRIMYWGTIYTSAAFATAPSINPINQYAVFYRRTGTTLKFRENKTDRTVSGSDGTTFTITNISSLTNNQYVGYMGEVLLYKGYLSDADCDSLYDSYLKSRWGLP